MGSRAQTYGRGTSRPDSVAQESGARGNSPGDDTLLTGFPGFSRNHKTSMHVPNQFLRVVLPNAPLTVIRLVALVLYLAIERHQNRWAEITLSYGDIIRATGMSPSSIRPAVDKGIALNYLVCHARGSKNSRGHAAEHVVLSLRRDTSGEYVAEQTKFNGFYDGKGYWTAVPVEFFSDVIWRLKRCTIQLVGATLTATEGTPDQGGGRVRSAPLSKSYLKRAGIDASTQCDAIKEAIARNLIVRVNPASSTFDPTEKIFPEFSLRWFNPLTAEVRVRLDNGAMDLNERIESLPKMDRNSSENGSNFIRERIENPTHIKEEINTKSKQQQGDRNSTEKAVAHDALIKAGFSEFDARRLSQAFPPARIFDQIKWLPDRGPTKNRLGYLRAAIEHNYAPPPAVSHRHRIAKDGGPKGHVVADADWHEYVLHRIEILQKTKAAEYARFESKRKLDRQYLEGSQPESYRRGELRKFDRKDNFCNSLQEHFPDDVQDLKSWKACSAQQADGDGENLISNASHGMNTACFR